MKFFTCVLMVALCAALLAGCAVESPTSTEQPSASPASVDKASLTPAVSPEAVPSPTLKPSTAPPPTPVPPSSREKAIETVMDNMSLQDKVASLFWVKPSQLGGTVTKMLKKTRTAYANTPVSGVVFFAENVSSTQQVQTLIEGFKELGGNGFAVGVDEEGGRVSRLSKLSGVPSLPPMAQMGAAGDMKALYADMYKLGGAVRELGFNVNFAPVCDVLTDPRNTAIGDRSFSDDPQVVADCVTAAVKGLKAASIVSCLKHFPGHGGTEGDSHTGAVSLYANLEHLTTVEWLPFTAGIEAGAPMVMVGHISLPDVAAEETPASLSPSIVNGFLRRSLGYNGLVITDSMQMEAITDNYGSAEAAILALSAGCDIILMPADLTAAVDGVYKAVSDGRLPIERIDEAVRRRLNVFYVENEPDAE